MNDIHQEWHELRKKNGDFICHLDGEMDKLEKKQVELKRAEQLQHLEDAGAFAMQFVAPPPFNCCQDDRDILKALNKTQADRIKQLEDKILAYKEQKQIDLAVAKEVDEKLAKATADYRALWVENDNLKSQLAGAKAQYENTIENRLKISELSQTVIKLREEVKRRKDSDKKMGDAYAKLIEENAFLQEQLDAAQKEVDDFTVMYDKAHAEAHQAKVAKDRMGYSNRCMQSKIAKQANEIRRLTEENEMLSSKNDELSGRHETQKANIACAMEMWHKYEKETETLKKALDLAAKDADANFERGKIKGVEEIWDELKDALSGRSLDDNQKIFGYGTLTGILSNLSPTWFINRAEEYHKQEEKKARDIQIGDEVQCFDLFCPDDDPHSDIGIVVIVDSERHSFVVIGPKFEGCFDETDIQFGTVKKTGRHFDSIPLDYFA